MSGDTSEPLWVYVPSSSRNISLTTWNEPTGLSSTFNNFTQFGEPPFSDTLVQPLLEKQGGSVLTYDFTGTRVIVEGTVNNLPVDRGWYTTCEVDGKTFASNVPAGIQSNHVPFCDADNLSPGDVHTLNFTVHSGSAPASSPDMFFDLLRVKPSPKTNLDQSLVYIQHNSSINNYDISWKATENGHYTATNGSKVLVNFSGTSLKWYGFYDPSTGTSREESQAMWQLDEFPAQQFVISQIFSAIASMQIGNFYFKTPELAPGNHRLEVTYMSTAGRPLGLHHFVIQNAPVATTVTAPASSQTTTTNTPTNPPASRSGSGGMSQSATIAVSVNVAVVVLVVSGFLFFFCRRRHKRHSKQKQENAFPTSDVDLPLHIDTHARSYHLGSPGPSTPTIPPESISAATATSKGTPISDVPVSRGSLHIRSWNDETPPPYAYQQN